ncbi:PI31 proteasome regulator N-terminal-domain-containing protein [Fennellomyces sp. T-0311]|nr:PI31 proteasome regulator N-terminal-domain-containing protein [Fennellomyces sp. T-0311]
MSDPLDPASLLHLIAQITPSTLQSPYDALAACSHAIMLSVGCKFAGLGDDARQGDGSVRTLPESWNSQGPSNYAFRYSHPQSSMTFVIKSFRLGNRYLMHGLAIEDNKTATLDIETAHFTSNGFFPYNPHESKDPLVHGFISTSQFKELVSLFKINILQRILPGLQKPGYEDTSTTSTTAPSSTPQRSDPSRTDPSQPHPPRPPIFDDPTTADDPSLFGHNPYSVGRSDLEPMGGLRMPGDGGGMFVGPSHPMFGGRHEDDARLPRGAVPPGARFDPIGPFMPDPRRGRGRGGAGAGRFSGEPDNDELPPPNYDNYFM